MNNHSPHQNNHDFQTLLVQSIAELHIRTEMHDNAWGLGECNWNVDQEQQKIIFTHPNGRKVTCTVQIIGTYNTLDQTWLWAWGNTSVLPTLQRCAQVVRNYGITHAVDRLTTRKFPATEREAWELTAFACKLCNAQGAYRGPAGATLVFMIFDAVSLGYGQS